MAMYRLLTPGPVQIPESVLKELSEPMLHHRTPEFEAVLKSVLSKLKTVFQTQNPVFIHTSTGSGAMESALINTLSPKDKVICIVSGKFGERWYEMAAAYGLQPILLNVEWGESVKPEALEILLKQNPDTKAVFCQACETSTAVVHPIKELAAIVNRYSQCIFIVDGITALGVMDIPMDAWNIDVLIGGSQKAFMLPTGLAFISFSKKAWTFVESGRLPRFYFDVRKELGANKGTQTYFSSPVNLIRGLNVALDMMLAEGLQAGIARYERLAKGLREGAEVLGFKIYAKNPSTSVTALVVPEDLDSEKMRLHMEQKYRITIMGGQDKLKGKILRVGTLGYVREEDIIAVLTALSDTLKDFGKTPNLAQALKIAETFLHE